MYDHRTLEKKWRDIWDSELASGKSNWLFDEEKAAATGEAKYLLDMFPYPSGSGLHVGHVEEKAAIDIYARYLRMQGENVLMPTGYDSFGLPTENYAIKNNLSPDAATDENTTNFDLQTKNLGISYDWTRRLRTSDPEYYKFTQWWFKFLYERGLAYRKKQSVNWCPVDQTVLANEQVIDGRCERCDSEVVQRELEQWFFKITDYAERLLADLDTIDWPESTKASQRNWIGKSVGINITYPVVEEQGADLTIFTTRPDTNFGATFVAVAPDSKFIKEFAAKLPNAAEVADYVKASMAKTERERVSIGREKTGVFTGWHAKNHLTGREMPIYVADFVLGNVGTGALVGVPGHDMRDFEFAQAMDIDILRVVVGPDGDTSEITDPKQVQEDAGNMVNSGFLDGMDIHTATEKMMDHLEEKGWGKRVTNYKLRDWSISRQRYWGAPIPMLYRELTPEEKVLQDSYAGKPEQVLFFHAFDSDNQGAYQPWLAKNLVKEGIRVVAPNLPDPQLPEIGAWVDTLQAVVDNSALENSVVTGRSLGAWSALKFAESNKVRKLILVCPTTPVELANEAAETAVSAVDASSWQKIVDFVGGDKGNVDFAKIKANVAEVVVYLSTNDSYIPAAETEAFFRERLPQSRIINIREAGHFRADEGFSKFPQLLEEVMRPVRLDLMMVEEEDLPVTLPTDVDYRPKGKAPLATSEEFVASIPAKYGEGLRREVDTMDTFVCSSWYFFRFLDPLNQKSFAEKAKLKNFGAVDFYIGGAEHTVLHLLYARFFTKVAYDAGLIDYIEPFQVLRHQGMILGPDNRKMSKRWGNIINPNDIVAEYGADTLRMYEMFMGPLDQMKAWNDGGVRGIRRFLQKVWELNEELVSRGDTEFAPESQAIVQNALNELIDKVASDIQNLKFNTAISDFMKFTNLLQEKGLSIAKVDWQKFILTLYPFAPFITSEMWELHKFADSVYTQAWPTKTELVKELEHNITVVVMVNGKLRDNIQVPKGTQKSTVLEAALASQKVQVFVPDPAKVVKEVFVQDKLINLVVKN